MLNNGPHTQPKIYLFTLKINNSQYAHTVTDDELGFIRKQVVTNTKDKEEICSYFTFER